MLSLRILSLSRSGLFAATVATGLLLLSGCAVGTAVTGVDPGTNLGGSQTMSGILHGGPNPIVAATITLYTTTSGAYGTAATKVTSTTSASDGSFTFTLPMNTAACPSGEYAYVTAYGGSSGALSSNNSILLMTPIGACSANYSYNGVSGINTYNGSSLWLDEMTTAVSAYALSGFMTVTNAGVVNISAPANNHGTASSSTPSAEGLGHAFSNALAIINTNTGQPNSVFSPVTVGTPSTRTTTSGVIPAAELYLLGNILQACVNSTGPSGTPTATSNDGSACGVLFSVTTPPQSGAAVPANTMQAMLNLARYPNPAVNTWNTACTASASGTTTATQCLFNLSPSTGAAYNGALTSVPHDWALAIVYPMGTGVVTGSSCGGGTGTCSGITYPYYVALDYQDNVYVLNYAVGGSTPTAINLLGFSSQGASQFATVNDTSAADVLIKTIDTDTAGHFFGIANNGASSALKVYNSTSGSLLSTVTTGIGTSSFVGLADPLNNIYIASNVASINLRKAAYGGTSTAPTYTVSNITNTSPLYGSWQLAFDPNLNLYMESYNTAAGASYVQVVPNTGTFAAPSYLVNGNAATTIYTTAITGSTNNSYGIVGTSTTGSILAVSSNGVTPFTTTFNTSNVVNGISAGAATALPAVNGTTPYDRYAMTDGLNSLYTIDGANGSATSGVTVYDTADDLPLGTYEGCYVISGACGVATSTSGDTNVPMYSPRSIALDSAGDIWVVSGSSGNMTELVGASAPTWPGLSLGKFGRPQ
jgi:hypothetical protein